MARVAPTVNGAGKQKYAAQRGVTEDARALLHVRPRVEQLLRRAPVRAKDACLGFRPGRHSPIFSCPPILARDPALVPRGGMVNILFG